MAQRKRTGPITLGSEDRNLLSLHFLLFFAFDPHSRYNREVKTLEEHFNFVPTIYHLPTIIILLRCSS